MVPEAENFRQKLIESTKYCLHRYKIGESLFNEELEDLLKQGVYKIAVCIYKNKTNEYDSTLDVSMAQRAFDHTANIYINKNESYIKMHSGLIGKMKDGFLKKGIASKISYIRDGEKKIINIDSGDFNIPLEAFDTWHLLSQSILQAGICIEISAKIGFHTHIEKANFLFTIDLHHLL